MQRIYLAMLTFMMVSATGATLAAGSAWAEPPLPFFTKEAAFEIMGKATEFKTATTGKEIKCNTTEMVKGGEVTTPESKAVKRISGRFTGCVIVGTAKECKTPATNPKEIVTEKLEGQVGYLTGSAEKAANVAFAIFPAPPATAIAKFECEGEAGVSEIEGCVIGSMSPTNNLVAGFTDAYEETAGVENNVSYEPEKNGKPKACEMKLKSGEKIGLHVTSTVTVTPCPNMEMIKD
jgi:hypothetical protein